MASELTKLVRVAFKLTEREREKEKFSVVCSCSPQNLELGHFTLLFCGGRQRNVKYLKCTCREIAFVHCSFAALSLPSSLLNRVP